MKTKVDRKARAKLIRARHRARIKAKRPAHKKLLLHPATVFLLLCVGVLLLGQAIITHADVTDSVSYTVHAKIPAAPLTEPAVIIHPKDGDHTESTPITVSGSCPTESYINLYRNDLFAGTTLCTSDGSFTLQAGLLLGGNKLQAHVFNITDDEGPLSPPVNITYELPNPPPASNPDQPTAKAAAKPFSVSSDYSFVGYKIGQDISWKLNIGGGNGPYAINVNWGDNGESNYVQKADGEIIIDHSYDKAGVYPIKIRVVDADGGSAFLQLVSLVTDGKNPAITGFFSTGSSPLTPTFGATQSIFHGWTRAAVYTYGVVSLMSLSYWLGEQHQFLQMVRSSRGRFGKRR